MSATGRGSERVLLKECFCEPGYWAGSDGHIYSVKRGSARIMAEGRDKDGYHTVQLTTARKSRVKRVSRLVCTAWFGPSILPEVRHLNGVKSDNTPRNLAWGTQKQNAEDRERHGNTPKGERKVNAKLTADKVREIRGLLGKQTHVQLAVRFGVHSSKIGHIASGRSWRHVS